MGTTGTSLYSDDFASDIRGTYIEKLRSGKTRSEASEEMITENRDIIGSEDEPVFWLALADTQWEYGRLQTDVKEEALKHSEEAKNDERWLEQREKKAAAWADTVTKIVEKLKTEPPPEKRLRKRRLYRCERELGSVFAYRFLGEYSKETGYYGKYIVFRKVSETSWYPGHIIPVVEIYRWVGENIPTFEQIQKMELLSRWFPVYFQTKKKQESHEYEYWFELVIESKRAYPEENLTFLGKLEGDDLKPYKEYYCIGNLTMEKDNYNWKIE